MTTILSNASTKYEIVKADISALVSRTGGASMIHNTMHAMLDDACVNTNDTFAERGEAEVTLDAWNREFSRNVEFMMANCDNAIAVGNLKHYGFQP
jgi:hypothetical protein